MTRTLSRFSRLILPLALAVAAPAYAHHGGGNSGSAACSGHSSSTSFLGIVGMQCSGDLAISGETLKGALDLTIDAGGALTLTNVALNSPFIMLSSDGALTVNGTSTIGGLDWDIMNGSITAASHGDAPRVLDTGSTLFNGLPGDPLTTPSRISWEVFSVPGAHGGGLFDIPGLGNLTGLSLLALAPQLQDGSGTVFLEVAGQGGILLTAAPVPEPGTGTLAIAGILGLLMIMRRRSRS